MTFQELLDCWNQGAYNSNQYVYEEILAQAQRKNLIPVIGAGLSAWVEYPRWDELLRRYAKEFHAAEEVDRLLAEWCYDEAAQVMEKACGKNRWHRILMETFAPGKIDGRLHLRPQYQTLLPKLFTGLVLTTNFDHCLERLYNDNQKINPSDVFQADRAERARFLGEHLLIKLHGDIEEVEQMVLTRSSYDRCYGDDPARPNLDLPLPSYLSGQIGGRPLLFLGCSLHQDRTCAVLHKCATGRAHYALLPMPRPEKFEQRNQELKDMDIYPIWYPDGRHDEALAAFFEQLAADCGIRPEPMGDTSVYPLVGRDAVVEELCAHFSGRDPAPQWITGVAGIGKTEVCREVIRRLTARRPHFKMPMVDCTNAQKVGLFYSAVARGCGVEIPDQEASAPGAFLARTIPAGRDGVYFDNFEDVWRGFDQTERKNLVRWLLDLRHRGLALLFSTQDRLPRELGTGIHLEALDVGAGAAETVADAEFWNMDSVKLFTHIYGEVSPAELPCLRKLIRQMAGHPLAIVLTAIQAREQLLGLRTLLDRWDAVQEVYRGNERHTSLKNALALVWEEVGDDPAATFYWALHTTCVQPIPLEFHRWLADTPELETGMERLQTGSLVRRVDGRIAMLLPIKEQLPLLMEDWESVYLNALCHWATALSELLHLADDYLSPDSLQAHKLMVEMMPQVCHVLDELVDQEEQGMDSLCLLLWSALNHYRYYRPSCDTLKRLVEHPALKDRPGDRGIAYVKIGDLLGYLGDLNESRSALEQAEEQFLKTEDNSGLAYTLLTKAELFRIAEDHDGAAIALDQAEKLCRVLEDDLGLANVFLRRGSLLVSRGDYIGAESTWGEAEKRYRALKNNRGLASVLLSRGRLFAMQGEDDKALELLRLAYHLHLELLDLSGQARCLGLQYLCLVDTDRAGEAHQLRPQLEALIPDLPPPDQNSIRDILAYATSEPEK